MFDVFYGSIIVMSNITSKEMGMETDSVLRSDPLNCDYLFVEGKLARLNNERDWKGIVIEGSKAVSIYSEKRHALHSDELIASVRDLSMFSGSLLRCGKNPIVEIPGLETSLVDASQRGQTTPYHTVFHYSTLNPIGLRERNFTGTKQEHIFINQVRRGVEGFTHSAQALWLIFTNEVSHEDSLLAPELFSIAHIGLEQGISAIPVVMKEVGAEYFARNLRPYFDPLEIEGRVFDAPGGAQMPLLLVDHILWASDTEEHTYDSFRDRNLIYLPQNMREAIATTLGTPSLRSRVGEVSSTTEATGLVKSLITRVYTFRKAHERLAKDSFGYRVENAIGSGGSTPDLLNELSAITRAKMQVD